MSDEKPAAPPLTGTIFDYAGHAEEARAASLDPQTAHFKPGRPSDHQKGVQWIGPFENPADGFAAHTRLSARALSSAGVPVQLRGLSPTDDVDDDVQGPITDLLMASIAKYELRVVQVVPSAQIIAKWLAHPMLTAEEAAARNSATVLYTVWERENIDPDLVWLMSKAGSLWTACRRNARALVEAGAKADKVHVIPVPYLPDDPCLKLAGRKRPPGKLRFLHIGKWEPRKAQDKLLHAFMLAFKPGEAELIVKTSKFSPSVSGYPAGPSQACGKALEDPAVQANGWTAQNISPSIRMIRERLTEKQIVGLHAWADVYCTVAHGEGFDMPAFASALAGNRLIYTPCGGPEDFSSDQDVLVASRGSEPVHPWYEWEEESTWASVDTDDIVDALRRAHSLGPAAIKRDLSAFSAAEVGKRMRALLEAQAASFGVTLVDA